MNPLHTTESVADNAAQELIAIFHLDEQMQDVLALAFLMGERNECKRSIAEVVKTFRVSATPQWIQQGVDQASEVQR